MLILKKLFASSTTMYVNFPLKLEFLPSNVGSKFTLPLGLGIFPYAPGLVLVAGSAASQDCRG